MQGLELYVKENLGIKIEEFNLGYRTVTVNSEQKGEYETKEFETKWSKNLLMELAKLKKEWFLDSYNRFENENYVQKQIDFVLDFHGISLRDKKVLDFGCGFGASTHCLMKRGAENIVSTELVKENMDFAEIMCMEFGYSDKVKLVRKDLIKDISPESYDFVWLQAVVEHLLPDERKEYLNKLWNSIRPEGYLIITETPNRLWPYETHTTSGTWFIPYMKDKKIFEVMRKRNEYKNWIDEEFYRSGIVGETYFSLLNYINDKEHLIDSGLRAGYLKKMYEYAKNKSVKKDMIIKIADKFEFIPIKIFKSPVTAFMPFLNHLAFKKKYDDSYHNKTYKPKY